jgi:hypothetical protein
VKLLPYHRFEITSALPKVEALAVISSRLEKRQWLSPMGMNPKNDERFDGAVTDNTFNITRIMGYRNSFAPVIDGEVNESGRFSRIQITMRPSIFVFIFLAFCCFIFLPLFMGIDGVLLPVVLVSAFMYGMVLFGFWLEANKIEQTLRRIFKAA